MKGGTLFSGIGTPELAGSWIDWRWCAEIDSFASAVHAARFPNVQNLGDVREFPDAVEPVELIIFGSPCQSFSVAGKRAGLDDPRGNMALIGLQIVDRVRPDWMVFENVPGLLSSDEWRDFGTFLGALGECGYGFAYRVLDAQYAGVPQRRRRVFVVGYLGDWRPPAAVLFEPESLSGHPPPRRHAGEGVAPILEVGARTGISTDDVRAGLGVGEPGDPMFTLQSGKHHGITGPLAGNAGTERKHGHGMGQQDWESGYAIPVAYGGNRQSGPLDVGTACNAHGGPHGRMDFQTETFIVPPLMARSSRGGTQGLSTGFTTDGHIITHSLRADGFDASEDGTGSGAPIIPIQGTLDRNKTQNGLGVGSPGDPQFTLTGRDPHAVAFQARIARNGRGQPTAVAPALNGAGAGSTSGGRTQERQIVDTRMAVRRLTPRECERLQGLPDDFTAIRYNGKPAADGPRYRALGNAMAVPVIGWILRRIKKVAELTGEGSMY